MRLRRQQPQPGERVSLGLRVTPEIKARLDLAAKQSGRSQSQEAEFRLEQSFRDDRILVAIEALAAILTNKPARAHARAPHSTPDTITDPARSSQ